MENNDQAWVAPQNEDMDMEVDEDDEEEEEHDDSEDDVDDGAEEGAEDGAQDGAQDEDEDVLPLPDVLGLSDFTVFDAGIADDLVEESEKSKQREKATDADITLYFVCTDAIVQDHPVLKGRTVVQIGMKKQSFLNVVFKRFVSFCNEKISSSISLPELEFVHATVLNGEDNAEGAALMKNDKITVRREQEDDRCFSLKNTREQRDTERRYFRQLGRMARHSEADDSADVVLNCQGLNGLVKCHSFMIRARCAWLWGLIEDAKKLENGRRSVLTLPVEADDEDGRIVDMENYRPVKVEESSAAHIESDDDDNVRDHVDHSVGHAESKTWVSLPHSAEAVRILLEYCYTNRVTSLGLEAFSKACKKPSLFKKNLGPVSPFTLRHTKWPNSGAPTVSMDTALEATRLAHIAGFPRLALMCEVAASNTVTFDNVIKALCACETIEAEYGAPLVHLRKIGMRLLIQTDYDLDGGVGDFLKHVLKEKGSLLVPTLLAGTNQLLEALQEEQKLKHSSQSPISVSARSATPRSKRDWKATVYGCMEKYDRRDAQERGRERKRRRKLKRGEEVPVEDDSWTVRFAQGLVEIRLQKMWQHARIVGRGVKPIASKVKTARRRGCP